MILIFFYIFSFMYSEYSYTGYYKTFFLNSKVDDILVSNMYVNFRNNFSYYFLNKNSFNISYSLLPSVYNSNKDLNVFSSIKINESAFRLIDFNKKLYPRASSNYDNLVINHNLDRLNFVLYHNNFDLLIGRQAINYGISRLNNPINVFKPYTLLDFDREELKGVDSVLLKVPISNMSDLDFAYVFSKNQKDSAKFITYKFNLFNSDIRAIFIHFFNNYMLGFNISKPIYDFVSWIENALTYQDNDAETYIYKLSVGLDYAINSNLYLFLEYSYNSIGKNNIDAYIDLINLNAYKEAWTYLLSKNYLSFSYKYLINTLTVNNFQTIYNLNDNSKLIISSFDFNFYQNFYLTLGMYLGIGKSNTEFDLYNKILYSSLSIYW